MNHKGIGLRIRVNHHFPLRMWHPTAAASAVRSCGFFGGASFSVPHEPIMSESAQLSDAQTRDLLSAQQARQTRNRQLTVGELFNW